MLPAGLTMVQLLLDGVAAKRGFGHVAFTRSEVAGRPPLVIYEARGHIDHVVYSAHGVSLQEALDGLESARAMTRAAPPRGKTAPTSS